MSYKNTIKREDLAKIFKYDCILGNLIKVKTNKIVTYPEFDKVPKVSFLVDGVQYRLPSHTVVWMLYYNEWPTDVVFHKDFNQFNLRITNLMLVDRQKNYALLSAYKNLVEYCDIKPHSQDKHIYLVRYVSNNRLKYEQYHDLKFAQLACKRLKDNYRRLIIQLGATPPL
jgi:HNH endonuclease